MASGVRGDNILVNGAPWPVIEVSDTKHRFRVLNASSARAYELALEPKPDDGSKSFVQIGSNGGLLEAPIPHEKIITSPAERFDVVIDFRKYPVGTNVTLKNLRGEGRTRDVMRFVVNRREEEYAEIPDVLDPDLSLPNPEESEMTRQLTFAAGAVGGMSTINNQVFDPDTVHADPNLGATEVWNIVGDPSHPFHIRRPV